MLADLSPSQLAALRALSDGRDHEKTAPFFALVRLGYACNVDVVRTLLDPAVCERVSTVRITAAGRARLAH